ncbi:MAG: DUF1109 domain-containing protein [Sphingomonadales bacterium]|nr:DUF1109 domain-containing protein [Sphingomonadales bacterium]NCT05007.1 DUF1109 domain-containing protein [Sphingomonadales bacterium]
MARNTESLIAELVDGLEPVNPLRLRQGIAVTLGALALTVGSVFLLAGIRPDVSSALAQPVFLLATGLFLVLGLAASVTVVMMARPQVGSNHSGWVWAAIMVALLPAAAAVMVLIGGDAALARSTPAHGLNCLLAASGLAALSFAGLTWWLRRGAPTSPESAGLVTGIAAGSFGIFAYSFHCTYSDIVHIGLWHSAVVVTCALVGRLTVPHLIRW